MGSVPCQVLHIFSIFNSYTEYNATDFKIEVHDRETWFNILSVLEYAMERKRQQLTI